MKRTYNSHYAFSLIIFLALLLVGNPQLMAQYATKHYIAPAPWSYYNDANEIVLAAYEGQTAQVTVKKSDGTTILEEKTVVGGQPLTFRMKGNPNGDPLQYRNITGVVYGNNEIKVTLPELNGSGERTGKEVEVQLGCYKGLIFESDNPVTVSVRNVASDEAIISNRHTWDDRGQQKGNSVLSSLGDQALGIRFALGYYRDKFAGVNTSMRTGSEGERDLFNRTYPAYELPLFMAMATENSTTLRLPSGAKVGDGSGDWTAAPVTILLNAGESYLFQAPIGTFLESDKPIVVNAGAWTDKPNPTDNARDGVYTAVPPVRVLGKEYLVVRGDGLKDSEQTTVVATEKTTLTVQSYSKDGASLSKETIELYKGDHYTFINGDINIWREKYSFSHILADAPVIVYSGTADGNEVDMNVLAPISDCAGTNYVQTSKFTAYNKENLPYFGYVLTSCEGAFKLNGKTITGSSDVVLPDGNWHIVTFDNVSLGNPENMVFESLNGSGLIVYVIQQGGGYSMSGLYSAFARTLQTPVMTQTVCSEAMLTAAEGFLEYKWLKNGVEIPNSNSHVLHVTETANYTVMAKQDCGWTAESAPVYVELCEPTFDVQKTVVNNKNFEVEEVVVFAIEIKNKAKYIVNDVLAEDSLAYPNFEGPFEDKEYTTPIPENARSMAPGTIWYYKARYTVKAADIAGGAKTITNTVVVTGVTEGGKAVEGSGSVDFKVVRNLWLGGTPGKENDWNEPENWTAKRVPAEGEDIEFGTIENNNGEPALDSLFLDQNRTIGNLINHSDKDLVIPAGGNQLTIEGTVQDNYPQAGTILVKADPAKPAGSLRFTRPENNKQVKAKVEFYNKAYDCATCGFYTKSWQYFGIPVVESAFPYADVSGEEIVNEWSEPTLGDKWITSVSPLIAFKGYEINNKQKREPESKQFYSFKGDLYVGDASIPLTHTLNVNYAGMNLIGNSYTAAIPINSQAMHFDGDQTVYLFNTGTRDQWRKEGSGTALNFSEIKSGTYTAVPLNTAGQAGLPSVIPSMHAFMLSVASAQSLTISYDQLVENEAVAPGVSTRSVSEKGKEEMPYIVLDVIGDESADRVWVFENRLTTRGFDNGWDAGKISEQGLVQVYVAGEDGKYQVATVPELTGTEIGLVPDCANDYTLHLSVLPEIEARDLYLYDRFSRKTYPIRDKAGYVIEGGKPATDKRFTIVSDSRYVDELLPVSLIEIQSDRSAIRVTNHTDENCIATVYDLTGRRLAQRAIAISATEHLNAGGGWKPGVYIVRVNGNTGLNETRRVVVL